MLSQSKKIHSREAFNLIQLFGEIGGSYEILMIVFPLLVGSFAQHYFIFSFMDRLDSANSSKLFINKQSCCFGFLSWCRRKSMADNSTLEQKYNKTKDAIEENLSLESIMLNSAKLNLLIADLHETTRSLEKFESRLDILLTADFDESFRRVQSLRERAIQPNEEEKVNQVRTGCKIEKEHLGLV